MNSGQCLSHLSNYCPTILPEKQSIKEHLPKQDVSGIV